MSHTRNWKNTYKKFAQAYEQEVHYHKDNAPLQTVAQRAQAATCSLAWPTA